MSRLRRLLFDGTTGEPGSRGVFGGLLAAGRFAYLALREFRRDYCLERSATLAFATVVSLIPLAVLFLSFAVQLGAGDRVLEYAKEKILPLAAPDFQETLSVWLEENISKDAFAKGLVGLVGLVALAGLLLSALGIFVTAERNFNRIWKVRGTRTYVQKLAIFWVILTTSPFILTASASVEQLLLPAGGALEAIAQRWFFLRALYSAVVPVSIGFLGFLLLYVFLPSAKVRFRSAALGGVVAAILWLASTKTFYVYVARTSSIYGSLAIFPLFLLWLYLNWAITLLGCEIAYVHQNFASLADGVRPGAPGRPPPASLAALAFLERVCAAFSAGGRPPKAAEIAKDLGLPIPLVEEAARTLSERGVVGVCSGGYCLLQAPQRILLADVVGFFSDGAEAGRRLSDAGAPGAARAFEAAEKAFRGAFEGRTLASLAANAAEATRDPRP